MRRIKILVLILLALTSSIAFADVQQRIAIFTQQVELFREICFTPDGTFLKDKILFDVQGSIRETVMDCNAQALALEEERLAIEALMENGSCSEEVVRDAGLIELLNGSSGVVSELACPGIRSAADCTSGMACNLLSSIIPVGARAARFAFSDHPTLSQCGSGGNCFTNIGKAIWDNLWDTVTGLYDLGKMGVSWVGSQLGSLWESEDASSTRGIAATEISDSQLDQFIADPVGYVHSFATRVIEMIGNGISNRYGCAEWTGTPHLSECIRPMSWECADCNEKLNMVCGVTSYVGSGFITAFFTGGATAAAQITSKIAASTTIAVARSVPGASRIAQTMASAGRLGRAGSLISGSLKNVWLALSSSRSVIGLKSVAAQLKAGGAAINGFGRKNIFLYAQGQDSVINSVKAYNRLAQSAFRLGYRSTGQAAADARGFLYSQYPKLSDINGGRYTNVTSPQSYLTVATSRMSPAERSNMRITVTTDAAGERRVVIHDIRAGRIDSDVSFNFTPEPPPVRVATVPPLREVTAQTIVVTGRRLTPVPRAEYLNRWAAKTVTTPEQNRAYIAAALRNNEPGVFFLDTQNTALKKLNDTLRDKSLVDAFGNRYNDLVQTALEEFRKNHPEITLNLYSDYKSMRAAIRGPPGKEDELMQELSELIDEADAKFRAELRVSNLVDENFADERWFRAGLGRSADEANLVTRFSRRETDTGTGSFSSQGTRSNIESAWRLADQTRMELTRRFDKTPLVQAVPGSDIKVPTAEVLEIVRKNESAEDVARILTRRQGTEVSKQDAALLRQYFNQVDQFSPGLLIAQRVEHRFDDAIHGGFSIDFAGVGSINAEATAIGLAQGKNLSEAIASVRSRELIVTKDLDALKERTENAVKETLSRHGIDAQITISGDDMLVVPNKVLTPEIRREISEAQVRAQNGTSTLPSGMRTSFFSDGIPDQASRSIQATIGETIEKKLRKRLEGNLSPEDLRQTLFAIDMRGRSPGTGSVAMEVVNPSLSPASRQLIEKEFKEALEDINSELISNGQPGSLTRFDVLTFMNPMFSRTSVTL